MFPTAFFVDGRVGDGQLSLANARGFFQNNQMPPGFYRRNESFGNQEIGAAVNAIFSKHPIKPGKNNGVGNYVLDPTSPDLNDTCGLYVDFVNNTVRPLYPNPKGVLLKALQTNLDYLYQAFRGSGCLQIFPYGQ